MRPVLFLEQRDEARVLSYDDVIGFRLLARRPVRRHENARRYRVESGPLWRPRMTLTAVDGCRLAIIRCIIRTGGRFSERRAAVCSV